MKMKRWIVSVLTGLLFVPGISAAAGPEVNPDDLHITELEEKVLQLNEAASGLQDDIKFLQKELRDDEALAEDYKKAMKYYSKKYYDNLNASVMVFESPTLSDGRKFTSFEELDTYCKNAQKDVRRVIQSIADHKALISEAQKGYDNLQSEQKVYNTALTKRRSRLAIVGLWKFQGEKAIVKIMKISDIKECSLWSSTTAYVAVAVGKGLDDFKNGETVFFLDEADIMDPYYYTGSEYEWGQSQIKSKGSPSITAIRVRLEIDAKKMHYKSRDQYLILNKL